MRDVDTDPAVGPTPPTDLLVVVPVKERPRPLEQVFLQNEAPLRSLGLRFVVCFVVQPFDRYRTPGVRALAAQGKPVRVLEIGQNVTESEMLAAAVANFPAPLVLTLPAYPRIEPGELPRLLPAVRQGADMAVAVRAGGGGSVVNRVQRATFHALLRFGVGGSFKDIACGVRLFKREILDHVPLYGDFFRFFPYLAAREGFDVVEVELDQDPSDRQPRVFAPGVYVRRLVDLFGLTFMVRFTTKPLRFFGFVGGLSAGIGALILSILAWQRLAGRPLADRPMLVLAVILFVVGIQAIALGLVGEIVVHFQATQRRGYRLSKDTTFGVGQDDGSTEEAGVSPTGGSKGPSLPEGPQA